jgi:hypothetical protein
MANFQFLNRSVPFNTSTEICYINNSSVGPLFNLNTINIISPSGCPYSIFRFYKNGIEFFPTATPTISQNTNVLNLTQNILIAPGENLSIDCVNLDPLQQTHSMEGSIE